MKTFLVLGSFFILIWNVEAFGFSCESEWTDFTNPFSVQKMKNQIRMAVTEKILDKKITPFNQITGIQNRFDSCKSEQESKWDREFYSMGNQLESAFRQLEKDKSNLYERDALTSALKAKSRQIKQQQKLLAARDSNLKNEILNNIGGRVLILGRVPQDNESRNEIVEKMNNAMGKKAIAVFNDNRIKSLKVVENNQMIKRTIESFQQGRFSTGDSFPEHLDLYHDRFRSDQVFLTVFNVFPYSTISSGKSSVSIPGMRLVRLARNNLHKEIAKLKQHRNVEQRLIRWSESKLASNERFNRNSGYNAEKILEEWEKSRIPLEKDLSDLIEERNQLQAQLKGKSPDLQRSAAKVAEIYGQYNEHLNNRYTLLHYAAKGSWGGSGNLMQFRAELGASTLTLLPDRSGEHKKKVIIFDERKKTSQEYNINFEEQKKAFKILYLAAHKPLGAQTTRYEVAVAYKIKLSPPKNEELFNKSKDFIKDYLEKIKPYVSDLGDEVIKQVNQLTCLINSLPERHAV